MANSYFRFKQFIIYQDTCSMKVTTDSCLFGGWAANDLQKNFSAKHILDIGSGTGLLSLMLAQKSNACIDGIELQPSDYAQSLQNIALSPWTDRIHMIHGNATTFDYNRKYDVIISNPPFYENDLTSTYDNKNIAHHDNGLTLQMLVAMVENNLSTEGDIYLLLPYKRKKHIEDLLTKFNFYTHKIVFVHQTEKHDCFRIMIKASRKKQDLEEKKMVIKENDHYSKEFINYLSDYYLHL